MADSAAAPAVNSDGVHSASYVAAGTGLAEASITQFSTFKISSVSGEPMAVEHAKVEFTASAEIEHEVTQTSDEFLHVSYKPNAAGDINISGAYNGTSVAGLPVTVHCQAPGIDSAAYTASTLQEKPNNIIAPATADIEELDHLDKSSGALANTAAKISNNADNTDIEKLEGMLDLRMRGGGGIVDPMQVEHDASEVHDGLKKRTAANGATGETPVATAPKTAAKPASRFNPSKQAKWHMDLRAKILKAHPEVRELYGPCNSTFILVVALFLLHWGIAYCLRDSSLWLITLVSGTVGMTLFHAQGSILHDSAHRLVFETEPLATITDLLIELTFTSFAETIAYSNGHTQRHHIYLGDYPNDNEIPDLCSHFAGVQLKALTPFGENILFVIRMMFAMIPLSFLLDPLLVEFASYFLAPHVATADVRREHPVPWKTQVKMISFQVLSGITIAIGFYYLGWRSMMYHFLCLSFETNAFVSVWRTGQDVSEHNPLEDDRPTNSHYYWLYNFLFLNTGYHNEHHTFPQVAGPRLPALKAAAPEFFTSEIKISYFAQFAKQFMSHFESYRLSEDQENTMGSVCLKKAQAQYAKDNAEKNAKIAELSRTTKTASKAA